MIHNEEVANRFAQFRLQFVAKNQEGAAKILKIGQATVSRIEAGGTPISLEVAAILIKNYYLNIEWLLNGSGKMQDKVEAKPGNLVTDITQMKGDMQVMAKQMRLLQGAFTFTTTKMNERMEAQDEKIRSLQDELQQH